MKCIFSRCVQNNRVKKWPVGIALTLFLALVAPTYLRADDWVLTASNTIPFNALCHDGRNFIAWGGNDQGDTFFSVSSNGYNWATITSAVPLVAFAAWQGQYVGVHTSGSDILLAQSTNLVDWADTSTIYTLWQGDEFMAGELFRSALIAVSESNVVVRLEYESSLWGEEGVAWRLCSAPLGSASWSFEDTTWTFLLTYDGSYFWRCTGKFFDSTAYRSRTGADWEQGPAFDWQFYVNSLSVDRGLVFMGGAFYSGDIIPVCSFPGGAQFLAVPYTGTYSRVFFNAPTFCLVGTDSDSGSPLLFYNANGAEWRRQLLPINLTAFAATTNTVVGVGQGMFYALDRTSILNASTNTVRFAFVAVPVDAQSVQLGALGPTGTVFEVQGSTTLGPSAEWTPLWLPSVSTGAFTDLSIPVTVSNQLFIRAVTIGNR